jgi:hypothetical protein
MKCRDCGHTLLALPGNPQWKRVEWYCPTHHIVDGTLVFPSTYHRLVKWLDEQAAQQEREDVAREAR